ncbi:NAD(P)/FAD-dependent oxidoreductase [Insolitispirillum peregrinum]|uniref:Glycine/D-amino acid oxidase n=1 Tax=Insolitispirillum peregrinum TaxID=80876 RepID=A0A1N7Q8U2_9PROT|nr:FAD-binding oxidoreductase [Insolitispirillum peregrinum]SIT19268.1 Glycine/D-amino acid oxidase [Insolitispirillum peregrinum]
MSVPAPLSPPSLWAATAPSFPAFPALDGQHSADIVVIGAGFAGLSAALHAAEAGRSVILLEAVTVGHGGAGRNNGQVIPSLTRADPADLRKRYGTERGNRFARLIAGSAAFTFDLIRRHGIQADAQQNGWLQPAHSPGRATIARRRFEQWAEVGGDVAYLDGQQVEQQTGATGYHAAWLAHSGGHVNPLGLARGLGQAAARAGAKLFEQSPVRSVSRDGDGWRLTTPRGSVQAGQVIVATDAYSDSLFPTFRRSTVAVRFFQLATSVLSPEVRAAVLPNGHALSDTHGDLYFFRPTADGRLVTGGALVLPHNWQARLSHSLAQRLQTVFPIFAKTGVQFDYHWDGLIGFTTDFLPHLHQLAPGILSVVGYNGRGVALATACGKMLAEAALGHAPEDLDLPQSPIAPIPFHGAIEKVATLELLRYRLRDSRDIKV